MSYQELYAILFKQLVDQFGMLDERTIMGIIGFTAGGPVNMCERKAAGLFVTCELSVYEEQKTSTDGLKFEFFSKDDFDEEQARAILSALGRLSMEVHLGDNHTVDISEIAKARCDVVRLALFSQARFEDIDYGLYRVGPARSDS
jgi:hypothetical protein